MTISFQDIVRHAAKPRWMNNVRALHNFQAQGSTLTAEQVVQLVELATNLADDGKASAAADLLFAGLVVAGNAVLSRVQQVGVFRLSRRRFIGGPVSVVARQLDAASEHLGHESAEYLRSVVNLHRVAKSARLDYKALSGWLSVDREAGIKGAVATLDWLFLARAYAASGATARWTIPDGLSTRVEYLADGLSTILSIYNELFGKLRVNPHVNTSAAARGDYVQQLVTASRLAEFRDWEVLVDQMGYRVEPIDGKSAFCIQAPSIELLRAVEMGHIHTAIQRQIKPFTSIATTGQSFTELGKVLTKGELGDQIVKRVQDPTPRYRLELPEELLKEVRNGAMMQEETFALAGACNDLVASTEAVLAFELGANVRISDFFHVSRMLKFMRCILAEVLLKNFQNDFDAVLQSMALVLRRSDLLKLIGLSTGEVAANAAIDLIQADLSGHVDILYRPLLPMGLNSEFLMMPLNVIADSDLYRNPLVVSRQRLDADGTSDPLGNRLLEAFSAKGYDSRKAFKYRWDGEAGDCDLLVVVNDVVLVLECKHSLLPASSHELRTSINHIRKAGDQLDRFTKLFSTSAFRQYLSLRVPLPRNPVLVTGIIMSNRMLIGWRENGHAVRGLYELLQFVTHGTITMGTESKSFWIGTALSGEDIRRFFKEDITYAPQWRSLDAFSLRHEFRDCVVETEKLALNVLTLARECGFTKAEAELANRAQS